LFDREALSIAWVGLIFWQHQDTDKFSYFLTLTLANGEDKPAFSRTPYSKQPSNPPDVVNNIIVHIYLNAKERKSHTVVTAGPVRGIFGIGTSHGGPGTHTNPVVITKDFDRDTLEFIEEKRGPANIVEVKATVSTPDRKIESTLNKAVNTELDRAIPVVLNRMQGPMGSLDNELRKELEQALVDEIAKNLGDTIDQIGTTVDDEDLGKLIGAVAQPLIFAHSFITADSCLISYEEGFNEVDMEFSTTRSSTTSSRTTTAEPSPPTRSRTTPRTTTTSWPAKATTTIIVDEMEESPFEEVSSSEPSWTRCA
uniref:PHB domain-containing protein n=1 Tax=Heligmosomoides polygyrus TaxID=6339 RepID=A0A183GTL1_HELPZ